MLGSAGDGEDVPAQKWRGLTGYGSQWVCWI